MPEVDPFRTVNDTDIYHSHSACSYGQDIKRAGRDVKLVMTHMARLCGQCDHLIEQDEIAKNEDVLRVLNREIKEGIVTWGAQASELVGLGGERQARDAAYALMLDVHKATAEALAEVLE